MSLVITEILTRSEQGATRPFVCRGDDDELYFVKGNFAGSRAMCCEWVAGRLAGVLGLPTPEIRIAEVPPELVAGSSRSDVADLGWGPVFASRMIVDAQEVTLPDVDRVPLDLQRLVLLFDWWVLNEDRTLTEFGGNPNLVWSNETGGLRVFDLNLAFDASFSPGRFWQLHAFRAAAGPDWGSGYWAEAEDKLGNALSKLDEIWQELPEDWLHPGGDVGIPAVLDRPFVDRVLGRFQTEPELFWRITR